ncbi:hypothetical protein HOH67_00660 [Candidatus Peregrinibacteria bacterium]|nr:hypothetical protein [Candidatus Peregrinibacteria bacterium]
MRRTNGREVDTSLEPIVEWLKKNQEQVKEWKDVFEALEMRGEQPVRMSSV